VTFERRSRRVRKVFKFPKRSSTARLSTLSQKFANVLFDDFIWMGSAILRGGDKRSKESLPDGRRSTGGIAQRCGVVAAVRKPLASLPWIGYSLRARTAKKEILDEGRALSA